jgi:hypothetical protein
MSNRYKHLFDNLGYQKTCTIKLYRQEYNDIGIVDVTIPYDDLNTVKLTTNKRLQSFFDNSARSKHEKPLKAVLIDDHNHVISHFSMNLSGTAQEERLPAK